MTWKAWLGGIPAGWRWKAVVAVLLLTSAWAPSSALAQTADVKTCGDGRGDAAIAACTRIIDRGSKESKANRGDAYFNRGRAFRAKGDLDRAIADYGEAIRINPKDAFAYINRGVAFRLKGDLDRAIADYGEAVRIDPKDADTYYNRGNAFYTRGDLDRAIADFSAAVRINPKFARAYNNRGLAFRTKGDLDRAIADFSAAIRIDPQDTLAYYNRGVALEAKGHLPTMLKDVEEILRLEPGNKWAQDKLAQIRTQTEQQNRPMTAATAPTSTSRPAVSSETRVALVIGNSAYRATSRLENPHRDAKAIADVLRATGFSKVIEASDLTREHLLAAVQDFAGEADRADWAMVYFAGHGLEIGGVNYLIPVDARLLNERDVQFEALPLNALLSALEGAKKLRLVVLDACRNNPFAAQMKMASAGRSVGRGLARIEPEAGTLVVYAARDGQIAQDGDGANSPFATALVKHMTTPGIEIDKMFRRVTDDVMATTGKKQQPFTYGSLSGREDYFFVAPK